MTLRESRLAIEQLGWHVIATKKHADGVEFDATNYRRLAKSGVWASEDDAMRSLLEVVEVLEKM